jgi:hypothetical protein
MAAAFREIARIPEFERDLKGLIRRFRTLEDDLETLLKAQIVLLHKLGIDNRGVFQIPGFPFDEPKIYKVKKFACRALKGRGSNSGLRLIYAYFEPEDRIELVEIYYKGDRDDADRGRIIQLYGK